MWSDRCYIIAEAGSNHDGDFSQARNLIWAAAGAEADAVKFQCLPNFPRKWVPGLQAEAATVGLDFLATPFDVEAVRELDELGVPAFKIAAPELVNHELIDAAAATDKPLILSTGMATMAEVEAAAEVVVAQSWAGFALLQCTSAYPTPPDQANLIAIQTLRSFTSVFRLDHPVEITVGLSDHTLGTTVPIAAAALGAQVIEKHFTLDRTFDGPDHSFALEPHELKAMVEGIRDVELALGDGKKNGPQEGEAVEARGRRLAWTT